jgi:hypothetical protein
MLPPEDPIQTESAGTPGPMLRLGWCAAVLCCLVGGFLVLWPYNDDRSLWWLRRHLEVIDSQLQGLKELLQDYKIRHGRYPTDDEGLAALDNFESRFTFSYYRRRAAADSYQSAGFSGDGADRMWWESSKRALEAYRNEHGRMPRNADELREAGLGIGFLDWGADNDPELECIKVEIGIDRHGNFLLLDRSGVLSPWLLPYIYANRAGRPPDAFEGDLADSNRWGYSVKVDEGIYVSSSGGFVYANELNRLWWERYGPRMIGGLLSAIGLAVAIYAAFWARHARPLWVLAALIPGFLVGGLNTLNYGTCYIMSALFSRRTPEMVSLQLELLAKYRQKGVISEETYQRAASAAQRETLQSENSPETKRK